MGTTRPRGRGIDPTRLTTRDRSSTGHDAKAPRDMEETTIARSGVSRSARASARSSRAASRRAIVLRHGYVVATWGEPDRVDMTHSVTKSFLSSVAGLAFDRGMIRDVRDTVVAISAPIYRSRPRR